MTFWRSRAACRFTDPDLFFAISDSGKAMEQAAEAKAVYTGCEVQRECLAFARPAEKSAASGGAPYAPGTEIRIAVA